MASIRDIDRGMLGISKLVAKLQDTTLDVGVFSDAVNTEEKDVRYVADYAITNEYGSDHIPARSFMRSTIDEQGAKWTRSLADVFMQVSANGKNIDAELYKIGAIARSDIVSKIDSNINPPNALSTIKKKGASKNKTLIDHGILRNSIEARMAKK